MKKLFPWLMSLLIVIVGFITIYSVASHVQRSGANYPQVQLALDTAASLDDGVEPLVAISGQVDIKESLAPFTILYRKNGTPVLSAGYLNGKVPKIERKTLAASKDKDYEAVTWEPAKDVKIAAVVVEAKDYYVVSGRNLSEVDKAQSETLQIVLIGTLIAMLLFGGVYVVSNWADEY